MTESAIDILLVEDDPSDVALALHAFKKHNLANHIQVLRDGVEALEFLFGTGAYAQRDITNGPRVVLLDLKLPRVSGLEVLRQLKAHPEFSRVPVVVLTTSREDADVAAAYALGVNSYIVKPVEFEKFIEVAAQIDLYWCVLNQQAI